MQALRQQPRPPGFTLIEIMVVTTVALMLMTVGAFVYLNCLRIYQDSQGIASVFETAKLINRDLRDFLGNIVAVRGEWIAPVTRCFPGGPAYVQNDISYYCHARGNIYQNTYSNYYFPRLEPIAFSGPHDDRTTLQHWFHLGIFRNGAPSNWATMSGYLYPYVAGSGGESKGWWLPGFFGQRDGGNPTVLQSNDIIAGSWGYPRPDYRLDADADDLQNHSNVACWFYAEDRAFNSPYTLALDNPNVVLATLKFSVKTVGNRQQTQLSFLNHHITGFDHPGKAGNGLLRSDAAYGNMLRSIRITPYFMDAGGRFQVMDDNAMGCSLRGVPNAGGAALPRCFDVDYRMCNPSSLQEYAFAFRVYCHSNPQ